MMMMFLSDITHAHTHIEVLSFSTYNEKNNNRSYYINNQGMQSLAGTATGCILQNDLC